MQRNFNLENTREYDVNHLCWVETMMMQDILFPLLNTPGITFEQAIHITQVQMRSVLN
jgi:hypothetical protein